MAKRRKSLRDVAGDGNADADGANSSIPLVDAPKELKKPMLQWASAKRHLISAKASLDSAEGELLAPATKLRLDRCAADNQLHASIKFKVNGVVLKTTQAAKYAPAMVGDAKVDAVRAEFTDADWSKYFGTEEFYEIDAAKLTDKDEDAIIKALGPKRASELLKRKVKLVPTSAFTKDSITDSRVRQITERVRQQHGLLTLQKPSFAVVSIDESDKNGGK